MDVHHAADASAAGGSTTGSPIDPVQLGSELRLTLARITRRLRQAHAAGDVTLSGVSVLARLAGDGPASPGSLAESERVRPQAMAATLAALEERGLVRRAPDATDGRRAVITITDDGRGILAERRSESVQRLAEVLDGEFAPAELRMLAAVMPLLDRLAERL
jgi:DNA-binding MarR family transcriptional regulator